MQKKESFVVFSKPQNVNQLYEKHTIFIVTHKTAKNRIYFMAKASVGIDFN